MRCACLTHALLVRIKALLRHHSGSIKSPYLLVLDCSLMPEVSVAHASPNALLMLYSCFTRALLVLYSCFTAARAYKPDFVLISAGFDAASGDPLGLFNIISIYDIISIQQHIKGQTS